jgi:hypothetical protein
MGCQCGGAGAPSVVGSAWCVAGLVLSERRTFEAKKIRDAAELSEAIAAGANVPDRCGRKQVPLSARSFRMAIALLATIIGEELADQLIAQNHERNKRVAVRVPKPARGFLELDELAAVIDATGSPDALPVIPRRSRCVARAPARRAAPSQF